MAYLPFDEDSYGYASLEASHSRKAVVTTTDSGGVLEFVRDRVEGRVCEPSPRPWPALFDEIYEDRTTAERMGGASFERRSQAGHLLGPRDQRAPGGRLVKILVATNAAPFVRGGAELLADRLVAELQHAGHHTELLRLPLVGNPNGVVRAMISAAMMDVPNVDRVIGLKFPAYLIPHDNLVTWLVHRLRQAYEPPPVGWARSPESDRVVDAVRAADHAAFDAARRLYCISPTVAGRLERSTGHRAEVLMTPPHADQPFRTLPAEDFIVALGRVSGSKRQMLALEAMRHARPGYRLVIAGAPETPELGDELEQRVRDLGLEDRVSLVLRFVSEEEKLDLLSRCIASVYLPIDEDSYGYVCYEAAMSRKPSVTATDSGGTHTLVQHDRTGLVVEPEPEAIAAAFDSLTQHRQTSVAMGDEAAPQRSPRAVLASGHPELTR